MKQKKTRFPNDFTGQSNPVQQTLKYSQKESLAPIVCSSFLIVTDFRLSLIRSCPKIAEYDDFGNFNLYISKQMRA